MDDEEEAWFWESLQRIRDNDPDITELMEVGTQGYSYTRNMTDEEWEQLGRDISNNTHLKLVCIVFGALNDHKTSCLFLGLTRSSSIKEFELYGNGISVAGVNSMVPFLQNANNLTKLSIHDNNIDDEGVEILTNVLQSNTSLKAITLTENEGISNRGKIMLLKLVNDVSSIEATLRSNHTLRIITLTPSDEDAQIREKIKVATVINRLPEENGRIKVIETQLHSATRAILAELQGVTSSLYSEINPLHLPEVLALVGRCHGQGELFVALRSSIAEVISTVNRKECLKQENSYYRAKIAEFRAKLEANEAELATIEASEVSVVNIGSESRCNKRQRAS